METLQQDFSKAQEIVILFQSAKISNLEEEALVQLYQPIIGGDAVSLYLSMLLISKTSQKTDVLFHADLFRFTNNTPLSFMELREKLEGIGLLDVYEKYSNSFAKVYTYILKPPKKASLFFKDLMLFELLLQKIGEERLNRLVALNTLEQPDLVDSYKMTKTYQQVFGHSTENVIKQHEKVQMAQSRTFEEEPNKLDVSSSEFDLAYLRKLFEQSLLNPIKEEDIETILLYHSIYGLNEHELFQLAKEVEDSSLDYLDIKKLKKRIDLAEKSGKVEKIISPQKTQILPEEMRQNQLLSSGFSIDETRYIIQSEKLSPMEFLRFVQKERGTSKTPLEDSLIVNAVKESKLTNQVVNMLVYFLLVRKKITNLTYFNQFLNGLNKWELEKIATSEQAMHQIQKEEATIEKRKTTQASNTKYMQHPRKQEEL
ncbi:MAG: DnaD domain protein, partial [Streptococcaceae bacterium]|nr:DnaD domain protein [Streptococcaceae bacterium]